jgi:tetratricopeptide (TPR) repeat protein
VDFPRIARLQQLMVQTRGALQARYPTLPRGARVAFHGLPIAAEYAYGGAHAVQSWYRDTTLRCVSYAEFRADSMQPVVTLIEYQPEPPHQLVLLDPDAVRAHLLGAALLQQGRWAEALARLERADSAQSDRAARIFLGDLAGRRAYCLAALGRFGEAETAARQALRASALDVGARFVIAADHVVRHERTAALAQLDTLLALNPGYEDAVALRARLIGTPADSAIGRGASEHSAAARDAAARGAGGAVRAGRRAP